MFTYVKLKNFMSFGEITFDFKKKAGEAKPLVAVYGENGSGKSNFVRSIELLCRLMDSYDNSINFEKVVEQIKSEKGFFPEDALGAFKDYDINHFISSCRMVECQEPTEIEYGFILNGTECYYKIILEKEIVGETLYCLCGSQRGNMFDISKSETKISSKFYSKLFANNNVKKEIEEDIEKFWGKHTFLSILVHHMREKNPNYIRENLSNHLINVIDCFRNISVVAKRGNRQNSGILSAKPNLSKIDMRSGIIPKEDVEILNIAEKILNDFFTQAYADIKRISYEKKTYKNNSVKYQLYVDKMIAGKVRRINFEHESAGTQQILDIIRMLLGVFCGVTVVYDEIDNGIHDLILNNIIKSLSDYITGQLIITTHNTMLLETLNVHSSYVICVDYMGNKEARCLDEFPIQATNNIRNLYIKGLFGGVPFVEEIDYDHIVEKIKVGG